MDWIVVCGIALLGGALLGGCVAAWLASFDKVPERIIASYPDSSYNRSDYEDYYETYEGYKFRRILQPD